MIHVLALMLMAAGGPVNGLNPDEHLVPEHSVYTDINLRMRDPYFDAVKNYERHTVQILFDAFKAPVVARVVVYPSFEPEYAIALALSDGNYSVLHLEPSVQLYHYEMLEWLRSGADLGMYGLDEAEYLEMLDALDVKLPPSREDVAVSRCERELPDGLGSKLYVLWSEMLFRTRYPDYRPANPDDRTVAVNFGVDGTMYHFSFDYPGIILAGVIRSPREGSNTGKFVAIAEVMKEACHAEHNEDILSDLEKRVDALTATLSETNY